MSWPKIPLRDLVIAHYGKALKKEDRDENGKTEVYGSSGIVGYHSVSLVDYPTLIIGRKGSVGAVVWAPKGGWVIDTAFYLQIKELEKLDCRYLYYALRQAKLADRTITTSIPGLNRDDFYDTKIPLPPLEEQKRIAAILDKADAIRRKRQQAIQLADEFLRSVFLDMFGDPVTNPKGFPISTLADFYIDSKNGTKCGPFGSALKKHEYVEQGVPVWNMDNISLSGEFSDTPNLWITESKFFEIEAYSVEEGDVIISRAGTVGKMGVVRSKYSQSVISTNLIRVRFGEALKPEYFVNLMSYCKGRVGRLKTGPDGSFTHMNTGILDNLDFPYPPVELQEKFISLKDKVLSSLNKSDASEIEHLFKSLSQSAFSGEL